MNHDDLKHLHPGDVALWLSVEKATWRLAIAAKAKLHHVFPMDRSTLGKSSGYFWYAPKRDIAISLYDRWSLKEGFGGKYPIHFLLDTIAHEVAHAVVGREKGIDHGPAFFRAFGRMIILQEELQLRLDIAAASVKLPKKSNGSR